MEPAAAGSIRVKRMREAIMLQCGECKNRNYISTKNKRKHTDRLGLSKFCRKCRKHTPHKEVK